MAAAPEPSRAPDLEHDYAAMRAFLVAALRARRREPRLVLLSVPAPRLQLEALWTALPTETAMLWDPSGTSSATGGEACLGFGEVTAPPGVGDEAAAPWSPARGTLAAIPVERIAPPGHQPGTLRFLSGLSFAGPDAVTEPPWTDFPAALQILPRWCYTVGPHGSYLHLCVHAPSDALIAQVEAELTTLCRAGAQPLPSGPGAPVLLHSEPLPFARWQKWLEQILQAIAQQEVDKVVAVRRSTLVFSRPIEVGTVLARLRAQAPQSIRFALRRGRATFLGATPELLLRKRGRTITTDALAGTLARRDAPLAELAAQLLGSDKDRREHAPVVAAIKQRLLPLCSDITVPESPAIRVLPHLLHLHTPIRATTRAASTHVLELVHALHPTPAVGGTPTDKALQLIAALEPQPRGYYAGPLGVYDEHGDGEFAVAIRSGVILGDTAYVYGGAGIVRGSDPVLEYAETATKMRTLLSALGLAPEQMDAIEPTRLAEAR